MNSQGLGPISTTFSEGCIMIGSGADFKHSCSLILSTRSKMSDKMEVVDLTLDDSEMNDEWIIDIKDREENDSPKIVATEQDELIFMLDQTEEQSEEMIQEWALECSAKHLEYSLKTLYEIV